MVMWKYFVRLVFQQSRTMECLLPCEAKQMLLSEYLVDDSQNLLSKYLVVDFPSEYNEGRRSRMSVTWLGFLKSTYFNIQTCSHSLRILAPRAEASCNGLYCVCLSLGMLTGGEAKKETYARGELRDGRKQAR